ncbi:MAG: hypothetical protein IJF61_02590 [Clostridia bacterium]|nr:hypothetical protein [Clostridia bacterium]
MKIEQPYEFRKKLLTIHEKDVRDVSLQPSTDQFAFSDGVIIEIGNTDNVVINIAAEDFADFFKTSMGFSASVSKTGKASGANVVTLALAKEAGVDLEEAEGYKGFLIDVNDGIKVYGYDDRGVAAALYYMEDLMCFDHAPFLQKGIIKKKPMMAPLMVHSGYGMEEWPDEYLLRIAHEGRDALLVFTCGINQTRVGYLDFNDLIDRAAKFGLDVYAYSFMDSMVEPDADEAEEYFDHLYGDLFRECPGLKGVTLVGEVVEFHSKDPHVSKFRCEDVVTDDLPDGKPWPGWYPCEDLPIFIDRVKTSIRNVKPDADIVLWSYNWGYQPEEARVRLIESLPTDITFEATFEMFDNKTIEGVKTAVADYSLAFEGPSPYFTSEAIAAKKRGIRFYAMTQAAGVTWDFGVIPYEPMPYQWMKRYENIRKAIHNWDLCGSMDTHHHGFTPSIITKFSKHAFLTPEEPLEEILDRILAAEYGAENLEKVKEGFRHWSEAITYYTPTEGDLCGASRVGPAYPFCLYYQAVPPYKEEAVFGARVVSTEYCNGMEYPSFVGAAPRENFLNMRIRPELTSVRKMYELMQKGIDVFESIPKTNEKLCNIINLGKFIRNCALTNAHAKEWYILKCRLNAEFTKEGLLPILDEMETLLLSEIENAKDTIPLVEADSRLGWEPTMLYLGDREHLEWKIRQVQYVLEKEMVKVRKLIEF